MSSKRSAIVLALVSLIGFGLMRGPSLSEDLVGGIEAWAQARAVRAVDVTTCYGCHAEIKAFHTRGKHAKVNCVSCHAGLDTHLQNPDIP